MADIKSLALHSAISGFGLGCAFVCLLTGVWAGVAVFSLLAAMNIRFAVDCWRNIKGRVVAWPK